MDKYVIYAEYPDGSHCQVFKAETIDDANNLIAVLEASEENYNIKFEVQ